MLEGEDGYDNKKYGEENGMDAADVRRKPIKWNDRVLEYLWERMDTTMRSVESAGVECMDSST